MYAVIRAGGKQYRVAPGDVIRIEKIAPASDRSVEFNDVMLVSASEGQVSRPDGARVTGRVVEEGRADKILVFHYKRKKQFKRLRGHRQPFTAVRITEIAFDGQKFSAPDMPERKAKVKEPKRAPERSDEFQSAADFEGAEQPTAQTGKSKAVRRVESEAGRKPGMAKRTAGAKGSAREAKAGAKKDKAPTTKKSDKKKK
jgi:large subunit ribosomal protein L21